MALSRDKKQKILDDLKDKISKQKSMIFVDFTGLKTKDLSNLRRKLKLDDCQLKVAKKTLMGIAFKEAKLEIEPKKLPGEVALVFGYQDEISPAKIIYQFSQENPNLKILAGFFEGKIRQAEEIIALAQLPSKEELLAKLVANISAPLTNFVRVLETNLKGLITVLANLAKAKT